jgi:probable blue pigment (indigoidine) exporter
VSRARNLGSFLLVTLLFGAVFPAIKVGLADVPPLLFAAARYYLSAALLLGYALLTTDRWRPRTRGDRTAVLAGGVLFVGGTGLSFVGLQFTTSGVGAIVFSLIPTLTVLVAWVLLPDERPNRRGVLGVCVGFLGVAIVVRPDPSIETSVVGELLVLSATAGVALGTVLVRRSRPTMAVVALTGWAMAVGATVQLGFALALGESLAAVRPTPSALAALLYLAVVGGAVGFVIYFTLLERLGALEINLIAYLVPIVTLAIGWAVLGEPIVPTTLVGFLVVLVGFALLTDREIAAELARFRGAGR